MSRRLKYIFTLVLLLLAGIPVVYLALAWHVKEPLSMEATRVLDETGEDVIRLRFANVSAFPVTLCGVAYNGIEDPFAPGRFPTLPVRVALDPAVLRPGERWEEDIPPSMTPAQPELQFNCHWLPLGFISSTKACLWLKKHLPGGLADRVPMPQMRYSTFTKPLEDGPSPP